MLEGIRKRTKSLTVLFIFGAIILVFIFWGATPGGKKLDERVVATINGEPVMLQDYQELYQRQVDYYKNTFKGAFTDAMAKEMKLKYLTMDILINRVLALKAAGELGIKATVEEVQAEIAAMPAFKVDGQFNQEQYLKVLAANRLKPGPFEKTVGDDIVSGLVRDSITSRVVVSDEEVKSAYLHEFRKIDLKFAGFDPLRFKAGTEVTDDEARKYLESNAEKFMVPLMVKVFFAHADYGDIRDSVKIDKSELLDYYDRNIQHYQKPPEVKARHILVRPEYDAEDSEAAKAAAKRKAEGLLKRLKKGENFKSLAIRYAEDPGSASKGGELGWFARGVMVKEFENTAFSLNKNEISGLVETPFGFHIIQLLDKHDAGVKELKEVEPEIRAELVRMKARLKSDEIVRALEEPFMNATDEAALREAVAADPLVKWGSTPLFSSKGSAVELLGSDALKTVVFTMNKDEASKAIETDTGIYILKVLDRVEPHVPEYLEIKDAVRAAAIESKARYAASSKAEEFLKEVKGGKDFESVKVEGMSKVQKTGLFGKSAQVVPVIGVEIKDNAGLFAIDLKSPLYGSVLEAKGVYYVLELSDLKDPDLARLEDAEFNSRMRSALKSEKDDKVLGEWLDGLRNGSEIIVYEERL